MPVRSDAGMDQASFGPNDRRPQAPSAAAKAESSTAPGSPGRSEDSFEDPPLAEELPAVGPPMSVVCPASMSALDNSKENRAPVAQANQSRPMRGGLSRERNAASNNSANPAAGARMVRLCTPCACFFEVGV